MINKHLFIIPLATLVFSPINSIAAEKDYITVSGYLGGRISNDLEDKETDEKADLSNDLSQALSVAWRYSRNKETEIMFSTAKQTLTTSGEQNIKTDLRISYLHFGGRVIFPHENGFSNSVGLGIGATVFSPDDSQYDTEIKFSGNITAGLRYELTPQWALRGDLRVYGTVLNSDSTMFCDNGTCLIRSSGEVYVQTEIMTGIEYKF
ncbi:outer membrane beta-barrel protein [Psychromonas sp. MME1]|uniref:outer membrane beta-barrel protein n=2 Tax=unclassified Psychromonas TaxID=2614957 RepID=UPI0034E2278A